MMKNKIIKINKNIFWKSISLVFIVLFLLILIGGLFKVYKFKSSFASATDDEISLAKSIAIDFFSSNNSENASNYNISASKRVKVIDDKTRVIQISFKKDSTRISYLVDINSKEVLMQSRTETYSKINNFREHKDKERREKEFKR